MASVLAPLLVGVIVRSYGWIVILSDNGPVNDVLAAFGLSAPRLLNSEFAVVLGMVHVYLPFMVLSLLASLQAIEPDLERAARAMGASPGVVFRRVLWPLSRAGVAAGCSVVFILASSAYVIPSLLGGFNVVTTPILIVQLILSRVNWPVGSALAGIHFVMTVAVLAAVAVVVRGRGRTRATTTAVAEGEGA
jgi:putative spermidine/putrescine transport system permease protein